MMTTSAHLTTQMNIEPQYDSPTVTDTISEEIIGNNYRIDYRIPEDIFMDNSSVPAQQDQSYPVVNLPKRSSTHNSSQNREWKRFKWATNFTVPTVHQTTTNVFHKKELWFEDPNFLLLVCACSGAALICVAIIYILVK